MSAQRCVCAFCGRILDSKVAMQLVRIGGVPLCDDICTRAYDALLDDRINLAFGYITP